MPVGQSIKALTRSIAWLACAAAACCPIALTMVGKAQVVDVRYGVIDPPVITQRDITIGMLTSIHPQDPKPKPLECSSVTWAGDRLVMVSDRHSHVLLTAALDLAGQELLIELPEAQVVVDNERMLLVDAEAVTSRPAPGGGQEVLIVCSMSNDPDGTHRVKREHLARVRLDESGRVVARDVRVIDGGPIRESLNAHFDALRVKRYYSYNVTRDQNTPRWGSVEGIAWSPDKRTLLCGLRNPLADNDAIVFTLHGTDKAFDADDSQLLSVTDIFRLDLGGRGVTDLSWDSVSRGYLITAALSNGPKLEQDQAYPLENLDAVLYWWSGDKHESPRLVARFSDLNVDGVCRAGASPYIVLVSDEGDVSEERQGRQSVLTLMHFLGPAPGVHP